MAVHQNLIHKQFIHLYSWNEFGEWNKRRFIRFRVLHIILLFSKHFQNDFFHKMNHLKQHLIQIKYVYEWIVVIIKWPMNGH